jgi:2-hydroxycyclohexanecarboxyl-CoA dehydrogenase
MDLNLKHKTAIVTGGSSNIGRSITLTLAAEKANVVIADIDADQSKKVVKSAAALGNNTIFIKTDVSDWESVQAMVKQTLEEFSTIDILVNNAMITGAMGPFLETPRDQWRVWIPGGFGGYLNCTRSVVDHMIKRKYGKIISIGSESARYGKQNESFNAAVKASIIAHSKSLARELASYGINVNTVCPAAIFPTSPDEYGKYTIHAREAFDDPRRLAFIAKEAETIPLGHVGKPEDVAYVVAFLASDRANFITGQAISVGGGVTMI